MACQAQSKACESAVDCPIDWTCDAPPPADCASGVLDGGSAINAPDSGSSSAICEAGVAQKTCRPPFADQSFPPRGGGIGLGEGPIPTNLPPANSAAPHVDAASPETDSGTTPDAALPVATDTGVGADDSGKTPTPASKHDSGCSIQAGSPVPRSSEGWFIAFALGAALTHRARQRRPY
jgi:MYXO-CTERM domain-containing protein